MRKILSLKFPYLTIKQVKEVTVEGEVDLIEVGESIIKTESKLPKKK
jgi:hypothetical protein